MSKNKDLYDSFLFEITNIPGSSDDIVEQAILHYKKQLENPDLPPKLKEIATAFITNLTEYQSMATLNSIKLLYALDHLSESARFVESQSDTDIDIEPAGRIKSFYSAYEKLKETFYKYVGTNKPIPQTGILKDIYATRDILHPKHDMQRNPQAFYKLTYKFILKYMEYIDELSQRDSRYYLEEFSPTEKRDLQRPKKYIYPRDTKLDIPEKDFIDYALEEKNIPHAFRYLADLTDSMPSSLIVSEVSKLKKADLSNPESYSNSILYTMLNAQNKRELSYRTHLMNHCEKLLIQNLSDEVLKEYYNLPIEEFLDNNQYLLDSFQVDACKVIDYLQTTPATDNIVTSQFPKCTSKAFSTELSKAFSVIEAKQSETLLQKLEEINNLDLSRFHNNLMVAKKIRHFSFCGKDYMRHPKASGYQSFHIRVHTPFGVYEKQIRTEAQHIFAEKGFASHSTFYKPNEKAAFHRLKVPAIFSPKRDVNGDLIKPMVLGILPFDVAVQSYYGTSFSTFSGGLSFKEFEKQFSTKKEFDEALLALSPQQKENNFFSKLKALLFPGQKKPNEVTSTTPALPASNSTLNATHIEIPEAVTAHPVKKPAEPILLPAPQEPHGDDGNR